MTSGNLTFYGHYANRLQGKIKNLHAPYIISSIHITDELLYLNKSHLSTIFFNDQQICWGKGMINKCIIKTQVYILEFRCFSPQ